MAIELLSDIDKRKIINYIEAWGSYNGSDNGCATISTSIENILRFWDSAKSQYLQKIFGDNLILEKEVTFTISDTEIRNRIDDIIWNRYRHPEAHKFIESYKNAIHTYIEDKPYKYDEFLNNSFWAKNIYNGEPLFFPAVKEGQKSFTLEKGHKMSRAAGKLAEMYDLENWEDFRQAHSMALNDKILTGTLCLSIHPLDYMTMSDNSYHWTSCMSWIEAGSYRQGTVEMMNSPCVVVAYLKGDKDFIITPQGDSWSNKKWRELIIVDPNVLVNVKAYPYANPSLTLAALSWLRQLCEDSGVYHYENRYCSWDGNDYYDNDENYSCPELIDRKVQLKLTTDMMYNDFGNNPNGHFLYLSSDLRYDEWSTYYIYYSGVPECMFCGLTDPCFTDESYLSCVDCIGDRCACESCGDYYEEDELLYLDGMALCESCYDEYAVQCLDDARPSSWTSNEDANYYACEHINDHCIPVFLYDPNKMQYHTHYQLTYLWRSKESLTKYNDKYLRYYLKNGVDSIISFEKNSDQSFTERYIISLNELTERGLNLLRDRIEFIQDKWDEHDYTGEPYVRNIEIKFPLEIGIKSNKNKLKFI